MGGLADRSNLLRVIARYVPEWAHKRGYNISRSGHHRNPGTARHKHVAPQSITAVSVIQLAAITCRCGDQNRGGQANRRRTRHSEKCCNKP